MKRISRFFQYIKENQQLADSKKQLENRIRELGNIKAEESAPVIFIYIFNKILF